MTKMAQKVDSVMSKLRKTLVKRGLVFAGRDMGLGEAELLTLTYPRAQENPKPWRRARL